MEPHIYKGIKAKAILVLSIALFCFSSGEAQNSKWSLGISLGPNLVSLKTTTPVRNNLRPGFRSWSGMQVDYKLSKRLSLLGSLAFERKGGRIPHVVFVDSITGNTTGEVTLFLNYNYISLPVLLQYKIRKQVLGIPIHFIAGAGIYGGLWVDRVYRIRGENVRDSVITMGITHDQRIDWGFSASAAVEIPFTKKLKAHMRILVNNGVYNFNLDAFQSAPLFHLSGNLIFGISYRLGQMKKKNQGVSPE